MILLQVALLLLLCACGKAGQEGEALTLELTVGRLTLLLPEGWVELQREEKTQGDQVVSNSCTASYSGQTEEEGMALSVSHSAMAPFERGEGGDLIGELDRLGQQFASAHAPAYELETIGYYQGDNSYAALYAAAALEADTQPARLYRIYCMHPSGAYDLLFTARADRADLCEAILLALQSEGRPLGLELLEGE
ncbi:MAG: hypothetical protein GXX99_01435 [Clostridiales bacterium]|nr:hypothetical protein [Clostridiales bacterium]